MLCFAFAIHLSFHGFSLQELYTIREVNREENKTLGQAHVPAIEPRRKSTSSAGPFRPSLILFNLQTPDLRMHFLLHLGEFEERAR